MKDRKWDSMWQSGSPPMREKQDDDPHYDPSGWLCCAAVPGFPFKRVSEMTLEEAQQTICHMIAMRSFDDMAEALAVQTIDHQSRQ